MANEVVLESEALVAGKVVLKIPQGWKDNNQFKPSDIKWVRTVNDRVTNSAYLPPDLSHLRCNRVITNSSGVFFCLQLNPKFTDTLDGVPIGDLILLYQRLDKQSTKCFTHLVTPAGNEAVPNPYPYNGWPGRWVKVVAMTGNQAGKSIPLTSTDWQTMGFKGLHHNLAFMDGRVRGITHNQHLSSQQVSSLQNNIWNKFQPWRK